VALAHLVDDVTPLAVDAASESNRNGGDSNAPHNRPRSLVNHLIANRASFLCTKAPMLSIPDELS